jgi:ABC-2 type transport system ATP-binding protein
VGVFLGTQNLHPGRSVRETIRLTAFLAGLPSSRADDRLDWSGLQSVGGRLVKGLSLGMKVRLGMAIATLREPRVLILDEPMNGLDVEGVQWIKREVKRHRDAGGITLLSSHLLHELEAVAERALILSKGVLVRNVSLGVESVARESVWVRVSDDETFGCRLESSPLVHRREGNLWTIQATSDEVGRLAMDASVYVTELRPVPRRTLEALFLEAAQGEFSPRVGELA